MDQTITLFGSLHRAKSICISRNSLLFTIKSTRIDPPAYIWKEDEDDEEEPIYEPLSTKSEVNLSFEIIDFYDQFNHKTIEFGFIEAIEESSDILTYEFMKNYQEPFSIIRAVPETGNTEERWDGLFTPCHRVEAGQRPESIRFSREYKPTEFKLQKTKTDEFIEWTVRETYEHNLLMRVEDDGGGWQYTSLYSFHWCVSSSFRRSNINASMSENHVFGVIDRETGNQVAVAGSNQTGGCGEHAINSTLRERVFNGSGNMKLAEVT